MSVLFCFFFFQAEDGIRDGHVTGVQTCALPICHDDRHFGNGMFAHLVVDLFVPQIGLGPDTTRTECRHDLRSEERRVGKECRSRWWVGQLKKRWWWGVSREKQ